MHDLAMDLTTLGNRIDLMTLTTERGAGFLSSSIPSSSFDRRERFVGQSEGKKPRPSARREDLGFERYPKNFSDSRRNEPPPLRNELRETDRRGE